MRALVVACGNVLRRDDGVAARAVALLRPRPGVRVLVVQQLTPELAGELVGADVALFVDADAAARRVRITPLPTSVAASPLSHEASAAEVVALARALHDVRAQALVCRLPAADLSAGEGLSASGARSARVGAAVLARFLRERGRAGRGLSRR